MNGRQLPGANATVNALAGDGTSGDRPETLRTPQTPPLFSAYANG